MPITNQKYRLRVQDELLAGQREYDRLATSDNSDTRRPFPELSPLTADETEVSPDEVSSRLLYVASDWNDLGSPDPHVADVAKQVLLQEVTYAGFCGATNVMLRGPTVESKSHRRMFISAFADAVRQAQASSPSLTISILLPMTFDLAADSSNGHNTEAEKQRKSANDKASDHTSDLLATWDLWHSIRTACKYDNRVSLG